LPGEAQVRVFLSYSRQDQDFAGVARHLVAPLAQRVQLWMDDRIEAGEAFSARLLEEIDACDVFVAALSPAYAGSPWCRRELDRALSRGPALTLLPLLLADVDPGALDHLGVAHLQVSDLRRWRVDGDRLLRAAFVDRLAATSPPPPLPPGLSERVRRVVLWVAQSAADDRVRRDVADLAAWEATQAGVTGRERARVLDALSGLHLTRRAWADMDACSLAALTAWEEDAALVARASGPPDAEAVRDDDLGLLGELHLRRALAARQLARPDGAEHLAAAEATFRRIRLPVLRDEKLGQLHREAGTHAQLRGDLDAAGAHFRTSADLLRGLPSERLHVAQASIKAAQVELVAGRLAEAEARLDEAAPLLTAREGEPPRMRDQVLPHYLLTRAAVAALRGDDELARASLDDHARLPLGNTARRRSLRLLLRVPGPARRQLASLAWTGAASPLLRLRELLARLAASAAPPSRPRRGRRA
jgi:hypothetical protein